MEALAVLRLCDQACTDLTSADIVTALYGLADAYRKTNRAAEAQQKVSEADAITQLMSMNENL